MKVKSDTLALGMIVILSVFVFTNAKQKGWSEKPAVAANGNRILTERTSVPIVPRKSQQYHQGPYIVTISSEPQLSDASVLTYWGAFFDRKSQDVIHLSASYESKNISLPSSCDSGLSNVSEVALLPTADGCTIRLVGGDTGSAYVCQIDMTKDRVTKREVHSLEFPNELGETTQYRWIPDDGR